MTERKYILREILFTGGEGNVPSGGAAGQFLRKQSSTDFDTGWVTLTVASLTGVTATTAEVNYLSGVTSNIQTQLDSKVGGTLASGRIYVGNVSNVATAVDVTGDVLISNAGVTSIASGVIVNADINASAAIAHTKMAALTASRAMVTDGLGFASASAVTGTELGYLSGVTSSLQTQLNAKLGTTLNSGQLLVGNGSNVATAVTISGDITINNAGVAAISSGVIVNADINASAAIDLTKLATLTASRALVSTAGGVISVSSVTSTELGYVSGVTSAIQSQLDDLIATQPVNAIIKNPTGTEDGYAITWDNTVGEYTLLDPVAQGLPTGGAARQYLIKQSGTNFDATFDDPVVSDISDLTASADDLNILTGADAAGLTSTELLYLNGVTSNIQSQLTNKQDRSLTHNSIWVGNVSNIPTALSAGTNGYVLTITSGSPSWQPSVAGFSNPMTTEGDLIIGDTGGAAIRLGIGTNGHVLTSNGTTASWQAPSGGVSDGDKGDITVSSSGTVWTVDANINKAWTGTHSFVDGNLSILGSADATKIAKFEVDGFTTATTRTFTLPNASGTVALTSDLSGWLTGTLSNDVNITYTNSQNAVIDAVYGTHGSYDGVAMKVTGDTSAYISELIVGTDNFAGESSNILLTAQGTSSSNAFILMNNGGSGRQIEIGSFNGSNTNSTITITDDQISISHTPPSLSARYLAISSSGLYVEADVQLANYAAGTGETHVLTVDDQGNLSSQLHLSTYWRTDGNSTLSDNVVILGDTYTYSVTLDELSDFNVDAHGFSFIQNEISSAGGYNKIHLLTTGTSIGELLLESGTNTGEVGGVILRAYSNLSTANEAGVIIDSDRVRVHQTPDDADTGHLLFRESANGLLTKVTIGSGLSLTSGTLSASGGGSSVLSDITAATGANTINSGANHQIWDWNSLTSGKGISFRSSSTDAASNTLQVVSVEKSGANSNSGQTTTALNVSNTSTGTTSRNFGVFTTATGGTTNWSLYGVGNIGLQIGSAPSATRQGYTLFDNTETERGFLGITSTAVLLGAGSGYPLYMYGGGALSGAITTTGRLNWMDSPDNTARAKLYVTHAVNNTIPIFRVDGAVDTNLPASTEKSEVNFNFNRNKNWATGALTTQREFLIQAPTYTFTGASTITDAYTMFVTGAPTAGTNATITRSWAAGFNGNTFIGGNLSVPVNGYINMGTTLGSSGYGFRDNAGTMEFKNNAGSWTAFGTGSGIGGSTGSVDNALLRADGTGGSTAQASSVIISDTADIQLGLSSLTGSRIISVESSLTNANLTLQPKGTGSLIWQLQADATLATIETTAADSGWYFSISGGATSNNFISRKSSDFFGIATENQGGNSNNSGNIVIFTGNSGTSGNTRSGHILFYNGDGNGTGLPGNIGISTQNTALNFQGMARGVYVGNATAIPTGNPADGIFEYSVDVEGTAEKYIRTESGAVVSATGLLEPVEVSGTTLTLSEAHRGKFLYFTNASGCTVTVPTTLKKGFSCIMMQDAAGAVSTTGATVNGKNATTAQYDKIGLVHYKDTDVYYGA